MDEFTIESFKYDVELVTFTQNDWKEILTNYKPNVLFVESCWRGNYGSWGTLTIGSHGSKKLGPIIKWCNENEIPTVFWNKEDPVHFDKFAPVARMFDYVYTTDVNMINEYRAKYGIEARTMSFYCQPKMHNPLTNVEKKNNRIVFAGSYYAEKEQRCRDFNSLIEACKKMKLKLDIYDRNYGTDDERYFFPKDLLSSIRGNLKPDEVSETIKKYNYQLNINTVKNSESMFARRVYESLACGVTVISNDSDGVRKEFGDYIIISDDTAELVKSYNLKKKKKKIKMLQHDGMKKVLSEHKLEDRVKQILNDLDYKIALNKFSFLFIVDDLNSFISMKEIINSTGKKWRKYFILENDFNLFNLLQERKKSDIVYVLNDELRNKGLCEIIREEYVFVIRQNYRSYENLVELENATSFCSHDVITVGKKYEDLKTVRLDGCMIKANEKLLVNDLFSKRKVNVSDYGITAFKVFGKR